MNHAAIVKQFLKERTTDKGLATGLPFVTISRQAGAGGHTLARQILRCLEKRSSFAEAQDWDVFDQKLCALLAAHGDVGTSYESMVAEEYQSEIKQFVGDLLTGNARQFKLYKRIFEVVRLLTSVGKVVLVGRGGAFVSRDLPNGIHIRLVAGEKIRTKNMAKMLEVSQEEARKAMLAQDRSRARMVQDYFMADIADPIHYHAVFNTEHVPIPEVAEIVAGMVTDRIKALRGKK